MLLGHRGCKEKPENTISAFEYGLELGLKGFEFDVQKTLDNHLVVFHDDTLDRTTNSKGFLKQKSLSELKEVDAGNGQEIPTFQELLDFLDDEIFLQIEIKSEGCELGVVNQIKKRDLYQNTIVISFNHDYLRKVKMLDPKINVIPIIYAKILSPLNLINELGANGISMNEKFIDHDTVKVVHKENKKITAWTVNEEERISLLDKMNVDYICTDYPSKFVNYI